MSDADSAASEATKIGFPVVLKACGTHLTHRKDTGVPPFDFIVQLAKKFPDKPILVSFSAEKQSMDECKEFLEPLGVPTFPEFEQPFEVLSVLYRCARSMKSLSCF